MKFTEFYSRDTDNEWRFMDQPDDVTLIGRTLGCGCCSADVAVTREKMIAHIASLEEKLEKAKKLLEGM